MFGNSLQGRALSFVTENAVAYANGMLGPDQALFAHGDPEPSLHQR